MEGLCGYWRRGFGTIYKVKAGGLRFVDLMDQVSLVDPEMRIRFTSPHPKDFPDEVCTPLPPRSIIHGTTSGLLACSSVWLTFFLVCSEHAISPSFRSDKTELLFLRSFCT